MAAKTYPDFGKWLTYKEAIYSLTAIAKGIDNTPTQAQYGRMVYTYTHVYAPLCEYYGDKIPVNSFFRCKALNDIVPNASKTSEHMTGGAIDLDCQKFKNPLTNNQLFERVRTSGMAFDQLIFEAPDHNNVPGWVHISTRPAGVDGGNRKMIMRAQYNKVGKMEYQYWPWSGAAVAVASVSGVILGLLVGMAVYFTRTNS